MNPKYKLSNRELDIMMVFWASEQPLTATDIPKINPDLKLNTVQAVLKKLLKKSYIKVADIVYHNTVLTRAYTSVLSEEEYVISNYNLSSFSTDTFIAALVKEENNPDTLTQIEELIQKQKKHIAEGD